MSQQKHKSYFEKVRRDIDALQEQINDFIDSNNDDRSILERLLDKLNEVLWGLDDYLVALRHEEEAKIRDIGYMLEASIEDISAPFSENGVLWRFATFKYDDVAANTLSDLMSESEYTYDPDYHDNYDEGAHDQAAELHEQLAEQSRNTWKDESSPAIIALEQDIKKILDYLDSFESKKVH